MILLYIIAVGLIIAALIILCMLKADSTDNPSDLQLLLNWKKLPNSSKSKQTVGQLISWRQTGIRYNQQAVLILTVQCTLQELTQQQQAAAVIPPDQTEKLRAGLKLQIIYQDLPSPKLAVIKIDFN